MILWGRASSVNVQKVLWALDECGLNYEHKVVGGKYGGLDDPDFAKLTPIGRVPVLQDDDQTIWESHAILRHLARRAECLGASDAQVDMWMEFGSTTLQPPFIGLFWQRVRMLPGDRDAEADDAHSTSLRAALRHLETGLSDGRPHIRGEAFSMADIALGSLFHRITDVAPGILDDFPQVEAWHGTLAERDGYQRWINSSYEELRVGP